MKTFTLSSFSITILHSADPNAPFISPPIFFCGQHKDLWVVVENGPLEDSLICAVAGLVLQIGKRIKGHSFSQHVYFMGVFACGIQEEGHQGCSWSCRESQEVALDYEGWSVACYWYASRGPITTPPPPTVSPGWRCVMLGDPKHPMAPGYITDNVY